MTNNRLGILLMIAVALIFASQDGISRHLAETYNTYMIVMIRYWFFALFVVVFCLRRPGGLVRALRTPQLGLQVLRGVMLVANVCVLVTAFTILGLTETLVIFFCAPLIITALSGPVLGEPVGWRRWLAICVGFCGVLIILRPGVGVFNPWAIVPLICAIAFASYVILTRYVSRRDDSLTSLFWTGIAGAVFITAIGPFFWQSMSGPDWLWMGLLCLTSTVGHALLIRVYEIAQAPVVQPFTYLQMVFGSLIGITVFGEILSPNIIIGALIIIAAGIFMALREHQLSRLKG